MPRRIAGDAIQMHQASAGQPGEAGLDLIVGEGMADAAEKAVEIDRLLVDIRRGAELRALFHDCTHSVYCDTLSTMPMTEMDGNSWLITRFHCEMPAVSTKITSWACISKRSASRSPDA